MISKLALLMLAGALGCQLDSNSYISHIRNDLGYTRGQMTKITSSAEEAARRIVDGGHLWVGGSQSDFAFEAIGRAGGLISVRPVGNVVAGDVVLVGSRGAPNESDLNGITLWKRNGAYVILFACDNRATGADVTITSSPNCEFHDNGHVYLTDVVENFVNLWTWTGEFGAACTRLGKMPVFYESFGLEGGHDWARKYGRKTFHDDLKIAPVAAGTLGDQYLDSIDGMLHQIQEHEQTELQEAGQWLYKSAPGHSAFRAIGHIWPEHMNDGHESPPFLPATADSAPLLGNVGFVLHISYQQPPQALIDRARHREFQLVYCSVRRGQNDDASSVLYIDPHWPMPDGCVNVPGYDIPILPASGVIQACIYWSIVQEAGSAAASSTK
jgi:hypothetical protein